MKTLTNLDMMKVNIIVFLIITTVFLITGCSSTPVERELTEKEHDNLEKEYIVIDASSNYRPVWIEDPNYWATKYNQNKSKYRYFSYDNELKVNRQMACSLAQARARAEIAGEIATFIDKTLASHMSGDTNASESYSEPLESYVQNTLAEKIQATIHGASIQKKYWEKRYYKKDLGAKRDFKSYSCAVLIKMPASFLKKAIQRAVNQVVGQADSGAKESVKEALKDADQAFKAPDSQVKDSKSTGSSSAQTDTLQVKPTTKEYNGTEA